MKTGVVVALLMCIPSTALVLRTAHLNTRSLWLDEAFSWRLATFSVRDVIQSAAADYNPPLYYLLLKGWMGVFGESAFAMRAMSGLWGLVTVAGAYLLASEVARRETRTQSLAAPHPWAGLMAAAMVSVAPFQVRWSSEARMYALAAALALFSNYFLLRAVRRTDSSLPLWTAYVTTTVAGLYSHTYCLFSFAAQGIWVGLAIAKARTGREASLGAVPNAGADGPRAASQIERPVLRRILGAGLTVLVLFSPWLCALGGQRANVQSRYWIGPLRAADVARTLVELFIDPSDPASMAWEPIGLAVCCVVCLAGCIYRGGLASLLVACSAVVPFALSLLISVVDTPIFAARYLIVAQASMLVAFSVAVARLPGSVAPRSIAAVAILMSCAFSWDYVRTVRERASTGARSAMEYIEARRASTEPVLVSTPWHFLTALYYSHDRSSVIAYDGSGAWPRHFGTAAMRRSDFLRCDLASLEAGSVWVIDRTGGGSQQAPFAAPARWRELAVAMFPEPDEAQGTIVVRQYLTGAAATGAR